MVPSIPAFGLARPKAEGTLVVYDEEAWRQEVEAAIVEVARRTRSLYAGRRKMLEVPSDLHRDRHAARSRNRLNRALKVLIEEAKIIRSRA